MADFLDPRYDSSKFFLASVNVMLQAINELPIADDVELAELLEAQVASSVLIETTKEVLSEGWDVNSDEDYEFPQDGSGFINIPANVLDISSTDGNLIMRNWQLYNKKDKTAIFDEPQKMDVIWDLDFNTLTHPIRNYITVRAAKKFQARTVMDTNVYQYTQVDEDDALIIARRSEGFTGRYNMLTSAYGQDNLVMS